MMNKAFPNSALVLLATTLLAGCFERPPTDVVQRGYRGTGMQSVYNPRTVEEQVPANQPPPSPGPALPDAGPKARDIYKNVQVLGDLSVANFSRHMAQITAWVSPKEGCNYCHKGENFADDSLYTKVVARRMIQMNQHLNVNWKQHVGNTGVTCYTCHRGNPVPTNVWFAPLKQDTRANFIGARNQQNEPLDVVALSSLPNDPFTPYLKEAKPIRVNGTTALPTGNRASIQQAEHTFGLMVHFSKSLGVNCTYCHNTRETGDWSHGAMATNATAYHGIRMVRSVNNDYLDGLTKTFPDQRLGPTGDVAKVNCATCHQGAFKPLYGAQMAKDFPELLAVAKPVTPLPPPIDEDQRSVLYFGVGSSRLEGAQATGVAKLTAYLAANPGKKVLISGYHSASGELAANQELAKQRAFAVRDAVQAAGIAANRVVLDKPLQTEANISGEDPVARRVEVTIR
jgi:photosynthetic reaction center cytochrome c subunit